LAAACGGATPATGQPTAPPTPSAGGAGAAATTARGTPNTAGAASPGTPAAGAVQPTPIPRTGSAQDLILSTTTSTQDSGLLDALKQMAAMGSPVVSRGDNSGTQQLELQLWKAAGLAPQGQGWYVEAGTGMGQTLQIADQRRAYTVSDRGTYLAFKERVKLDILVQKDERLLNVYHVIAVNPQRFAAVNAAGAQAFVDFLLAPDTQRFIGEFGRDK